MKKIAVVTDSNSGITQKLAERLKINVIPMPFFIDGKVYYEDITLTQEAFYEQLGSNADISTSQPAPADIQELWDRLLQEYEEIVHIPMSSGLSGSYQTARMLAEDYDEKVHVVNNQRISVTQKRSVYDAIGLMNAGKTGSEIKQILEENKYESSIYITLETLKYLKRGGRITPAAAALGTILNLKPVLQIQGEKLDAFSKARGKKAAKRIMLEAMKRDFETRFQDAVSKKEIDLMYAYTGSSNEAEEWKQEIKEIFPEYKIQGDPLSLSVACHIGAGAIAIACSKRVTCEAEEIPW